MQCKSCLVPNYEGPIGFSEPTWEVVDVAHADLMVFSASLDDKATLDDTL